MLTTYVFFTSVPMNSIATPTLLPLNTAKHSKIRKQGLTSVVSQHTYLGKIQNQNLTALVNEWDVYCNTNFTFQKCQFYISVQSIQFFLHIQFKFVNYLFLNYQLYVSALLILLSVTELPISRLYNATFTFLKSLISLLWTVYFMIRFIFATLVKFKTV